jgi:SAM-dependent methyltransferase
MSAPSADALAPWIDDLQARHLRDLTASEVARALRALSATYVERRARLSGRGAFDSVGKRAAYALYYAPRRLLTVGHVLQVLSLAPPPGVVVDVGCGTGAAGAAWASSAPDRTQVIGLDSHPWALEETRATLRALGLRGDARRLEITPDRLTRVFAPRSPSPDGRGYILSYVVNELGDDVRGRLLPALIGAGSRGERVLVVEPLSRRTSPWWPRWTDAVIAAGGRADEWRLTLDPPAIVTRLGRAAGLDPLEATCRTLWL